MNELLRRYRLLRLKFRAYVLQAEADHAEELLHDHNRRYRRCSYELAQVKRRIMMLEKPEVLLKDIA